MFFHAGTHIGGLDHSAQALGRGNGLQARHAHAQNHHARGLDRARRRHEHGEKALVAVYRHHHRLVARDVGLRGQHIHALRAGGARRRFQRKTGQAGSGQLGQALSVKGVEHAHQSCAGLHLRELLRGGGTDFEHQFTTERALRIGDLGAYGLVSSIDHAGGHTGAGLNVQAVPLGFEFFGRLRRQGDASFTWTGFGWNAYAHKCLLKAELTPLPSQPCVSRYPTVRRLICWSIVLEK